MFCFFSILAENGHFWRSRHPKKEFFPFKIPKFSFSQSVRMKCIADVVSFFFLFGQPMTIYGGQGSQKMRFSLFKISKLCFCQSIRIEEWIIKMQSFFMARSGPQNDQINSQVAKVWVKMYLDNNVWIISGQYLNNIRTIFGQN